ncbi:methyl-accepting chemotaxis protein [Vibrio hannami]|uniref:methyl-accepting chemotaxis protein n=1 Tax=Vibrio hannami TaxID=2717094 RepID=UPI00240F5236|nr:methyl-accepting chemotaxis protein [Vibrio hannami]MDG3085706.1 methyl-accepting chemotaxis protein [Vibrio hannami]
MFKNLRLGLKIGLGFGVVLLLLSIVLGISISALNKTDNGITQYRDLANATNLSGELQANMLMVQTSVKDYLISKSSDDLEQYQNYLTKMQGFLDNARAEISEPKRAERITNMSKAIDTYKQGFSKVVDIVNETNRVHDEELVPYGEEMSVAIADLVETAFDDESSDVAYYSALVQERMLLGRIYSVKFLQTNSESDFVVAIKFIETAINHQVDELNQYINNGDYRELLEEFNNARSAYIENINLIHNLIIERNQIIEGTLNFTGVEVASTLEQIKLSVMQEQNLLGPELKKNTDNSINLTLLLSFSAILLGIIAAYTLTINITRPLHRAVTAANQLSNGDLTVHVETTRKDETGLLLKAIQNTATNLKGMISTISGASSNLSSAYDELAVVTEQTQEGIVGQEAETDMVATAMNEMSVTVHEVADNASKAAEAANQADTQAKSGSVVVGQTINSINSLSDSVHLSSEKLSEVEQEVANISSILDVIRGIADQTNLLALNAAIEAARAGEQGRGFAVVADEVRTLASRTQGSTQEIQDLIEQLQTGTKATVQAMSRGRQQADDCVKQAAQAGDALNAITKAIGIINDMNMQIASASEQQSSVAESINMNVINVKSIAEQNTVASNQTLSSSNEIDKLATQLKMLVTQFKV